MRDPFTATAQAAPRFTAAAATSFAAALAAALALTSGPASAQTPPYVSPAARVTTPGNVNNIVPFTQTIHYQQIHDVSSFSSTSLGVWQRMQFIADLATPPGTIDTELFIAESPNTAFHVDATFANNVIPGTEVNVFTRKMYNFPSVAANTWGAVDFVFDAPFVFTGTKPISWRIVIWSNTVASNFVLDCFSDWRFGGTVGTGCKHPLGTQPASHNSTFRSPGNVWDLNGYTWVNNMPMPGFLLVGTSTSVWNGIPLPLDLTAFGAPGCSIYTDGAIVVPVVSGPLASGFVGVKPTLPNNPLLIGGQVYTQFVWLDAGANALGVFTTNARNNSPIPAPNGIARNYASGNPSATVGGKEIEFGVPVGFL